MRRLIVELSGLVLCSIVVIGCGRAVRPGNEQQPPPIQSPPSSKKSALGVCQPAAVARQPSQFEGLLEPGALEQEACRLTARRQQYRDGTVQGESAITWRYQRSAAQLVIEHLNGERVVSRTTVDSASGLRTRESFGEQGELQTRTSERVDAQGRLLSFEQTQPVNGSHYAAQQTFEGDHLIARNEQSNEGNLSYSWRYDDDGRLVESRYESDMHEIGSWRTRYGYDARGRLTLLEREADGREVDRVGWSYRADGTLQRRTLSRDPQLMRWTTPKLDDLVADSRPWALPPLDDASASEPECRKAWVGISEGYRQADYRIVGAFRPAALADRRGEPAVSWQGHLGRGGSWVSPLLARYKGVDRWESVSDYDASGRMLSERFSEVVDSEVFRTHTRERTFGSAGLERDQVTLESETHAKVTRTLQFDRDAAGRLTSVTLLHDGAPIERQAMAFSGELLASSEWHGLVSPFAFLAKPFEPHGSLAVELLLRRTREHRAGRVVREVEETANGSRVERSFRYDADGRVLEELTRSDGVLASMRRAGWDGSGRQVLFGKREGADADQADAPWDELNAVEYTTAGLPRRIESVISSVYAFMPFHSIETREYECRTDG